MEFLIENWEKIAFICMIFGWFVIWRKDSQHTEDRHKDQMDSIMKILEDLRGQMSEEHRVLSKIFKQLDEHTINEHREIAEALTKLNTSLNHHIDDERANRKK